MGNVLKVWEPIGFEGLGFRFIRLGQAEVMARSYAKYPYPCM